MKIILFTLLATFSNLGFAVDFKAGPIWHQADAEIKCPAVCASHQVQWNHNWTTLNNGMSVCGCEGVTRYEAGPIWHQADAEVKCPSVCTSQDGQWTMEWTTTQWGRMSVCECRL